MEHNDRPYLIAGPCSVESREQLQQICEALSRQPRVRLIRGGVWKPRTRPGGFEGLGEPALRWMQELRESPLRMADGSPLRFCCEVARPEHVELCRRYGIDTVWIGARTTSNPFMVDDLCQALHNSGMAVMVKNPVSPDIRLWLGAIERLQHASVDNISAIHRGFNMYDNHGYRNEPLWEVAMELRHQLPTLPILCDPSHIGGSTALVPQIAKTALQLDYDGLMVEVHPSPTHALTDAAQQLTPDELRDLTEKLLSRQPAANGQPSATIAPELALLRRKIDSVDHDLLQLLGQRMQCSHQIATLKREAGMTVYQSDRWASMVDDRLRQAARLGLNEAFTRELLEKIHGESIRIQMEK